MQYGLSPEYVLDKIQSYEIKALSDFSYLKNKEDWEQTRLISYVTAQCQSTRKMNVTDIVEFPWEKKEPTKKQVQIDKQKIEQLKTLAQEMIKNKMI